MRKNNKYASIDNLNFKRIMEREERQDFFQNYKSKGLINENIDEKLQVRRQREHINLSTQELQAKIKARKKEIETKKKE